MSDKQDKRMEDLKAMLLDDSTPIEARFRMMTGMVVANMTAIGQMLETLAGRK